MLEIIDHIRDYAAKQNPAPTVRETYFAYNEQTGQWITSNEEVAPVMLLLQFVEANTIRDNTTFQIIAQWLYTTTVGDNAIRPYQQQALHELQALTHYLAGDNDTLPLYEIAGARYTTIHTEQPYIAAGATVTWTLTAKDFFFRCCDDLPVTQPDPECQVCPEFNLQASINEADARGAQFVAPNSPLNSPADVLVMAFDYNALPVSPLSVYFVDTAGVTIQLAIAGLEALSDTQFAIFSQFSGDLGEGAIYTTFDTCEAITIPVPSMP